MKRFIYIFLTLCCVTASYGQDPELSRLANTVKSLKASTAQAFDKVVADLSGDALWTPMNELKASEAGVECRASDRVPGFRLNKALAGAEQAQRFETAAGKMLNGEDARFNYSLYERALKPNVTANYKLHGRSGEQTFVLIPFGGADALLSIEISSGGTPFARKVFTDGSVMLSGTVAPGVPVELRISNASNSGQSFALLNHNSRK